MQLGAEERLTRQVVQPKGTPLDSFERGDLVMLLNRLGVSGSIRPGNPQPMMNDPGYRTIEWTSRDMVNVKQRQIVAEQAARSQTFASEVISEIVALQNIGATPMQFLGEYDIEKPTTVRVPVMVGQPLTVEYATGQAPVEPAPAKPPVNWINIAMLGVPLLRLLTARKS